MRIPTLKALKAKWPDQAETIYGILRGTISPHTIPETKAWVDKCYNYPRSSELKMDSISHVLGMYGVEALEGEYVNSYYGYIQATYVNAGDTYAVCIVRDSLTGDYHLSTLEGYVEKLERKRRIRRSINDG